MRVRNTFFFFQAEDGIRDKLVTGVQTCALPILSPQVERTVSRGRYEQDEFRLIEQVLSPGDVVLEVGAGLGLVSAYCAKRLGSSRVFAYEANPDLEACIRETYSLNEHVRRWRRGRQGNAVPQRGPVGVVGAPPERQSPSGRGSPKGA